MGSLEEMIVEELGMKKGVTVSSQLGWQLVKKFCEFKKGYTLCSFLAATSECAAFEKPDSVWPFLRRDGCAS